MVKLMKYEFRKTLFSKFVLLLVAAVAEVMLLAGIFADWEKGVLWGIGGLFLCALIGLIYIGIESLIVFHRDLNTKQSYMLFLTPRNSFQILGAKILENGLAILVSGLFFAALAAINTTIAFIHIGGLEELWALIKEFARQISIDLDIPWQHLLIGFLAVLAAWLMTIVVGYLAIVLSATVFAGKRLSGVVSFVIYLIISWIAGNVLDGLPAMNDAMMQAALTIGVAFLIIVIMYLLTGWIMERKLSV